MYRTELTTFSCGTALLGKMRDPSTLRFSSSSPPFRPLHLFRTPLIFLPFATEVKSYNQPFELGKPIDTLAIGEVIRSEHADVKVGDLWRGLLPLSEYVVVKGDLLKMGRVHKNEEGLPFTTLVGAVRRCLPLLHSTKLTILLTQAGMPGSTAFVGLTAIGKIQKGETIFISAASGAVGQIAVALALREGLKVIASAGSDDKVAFVKELGADVVFNCASRRRRRFFDISIFASFSLRG